MERTELEKKIIEKGKGAFRYELQDAARPMLSVLKKYGLGYGHELLGEITLNYPYRDDHIQNALRIPNDEGLKSIENKILENFMQELTSIKDRINDLDI